MGLVPMKWNVEPPDDWGAGLPTSLTFYKIKHLFFKHDSLNGINIFLKYWTAFTPTRLKAWNNNNNNNQKYSWECFSFLRSLWLDHVLWTCLALLPSLQQTAFSGEVYWKEALTGY